MDENDAVAPLPPDEWGPSDESYRTCSVCGGDCDPDPIAEDVLGVRIAFICPRHGMQTLVDPFEDLR